MIHSLRIIFKKNDESGYGSYMGSLMHGVLMEHISSEYADKMHISQIHPYSQYTYFENGRIVWCITALNDEAGRYITDVFMSADFSKVHIKKHDIVLEVDKKIYSTVSYSELFNKNYLSENTYRYVQIEFITPVSFKSNGNYIIFPEARMILNNLIRKYDSSSCETQIYDELLLEQIEKNTDIVEYSLRSVKFYMEGIKIPSFIGKITLKFSGASEFIRLMNMLTEYGEYSGTGIKTSIGMGAYKITDKRGKC